MHPKGKLVHLHAMYTKTGIFAVCKCNILHDPIYMMKTVRYEDEDMNYEDFEL